MVHACVNGVPTFFGGAGKLRIFERDVVRKTSFWIRWKSLVMGKILFYEEGGRGLIGFLFRCGAVREGLMGFFFNGAWRNLEWDCFWAQGRGCLRCSN